MPTASKNTTRHGYTNFFVPKFNISLLEKEHTEMPLNGPREGSVALSSNRVCKDVSLPPSLARHTRLECCLKLTISCEACMSIHICDSTYVSPYPPSLALPKNIFGRGLARLRSKTNCRRKNIERLSYVGKRWK